MAKQTFTTGQVLTAAQQNSLQSNDFNQTVSVKTANYSLLAADKGTRIEFNTSGSVTCTVNSGQFDAGDTLVIQNRGAGTATITAGTATVNTSASLALAQYSAGTLYFVSDSAALFFGDAAGISASLIDAKGDLIVGTADNTVGRLAVGTNGHTLVADSSVSPTGLKWAAPSSGAFTLIARTSFTNVASQSFDNFSSTYNSYMVVIESIWNVNQNDANLRLTMRYGGTDGTAHYGQATTNAFNSNTWSSLNTPLTSNYVEISPDTGVAANPNIAVIYFMNGFADANQDAQFFGTFINVNGAGQTMFTGVNLSNQQYTGFKLASSTQNIDGTVAIYGLAKA